MLQDFISSITNKQKNSSIIMIMILTLILTPNLLHCRSLSVFGDQIMDLYYYDMNDGMNKKQEQPGFSLSRGEWFIFRESDNVEFHPEKPGILYYDSEDMDKVLYLEPPLRVLIFPREENDGMPFVGPSEKSEKPINYTKIFPNKKEEFGNQNKLNEQLNTFINQVLGRNNWVNHIKNWNHLPFYYARKKEDKQASFNNHFYLLKGFKENFTKMFGLDNVQKMSFLNILYSEESFDIHVQLLLAKFCKYIYYGGDELMLYNKSSNFEQQVKSIYVDQAINIKLKELLSDKSSDFYESIENIILPVLEEFYDIAKSLIENYVNLRPDKYLESFFENSTGKTIFENISNQYAMSMNVPINQDMHIFNNSFLAFSKIFDFSNPNPNYGEQFSGIKDSLLNFIKQKYETLVEISTNLDSLLPTGKLNPEMLNDGTKRLSKKYEEMKRKDFMTDFEDEDKNKYLEKLDSLEWTDIIVDHLSKVILGEVNRAYETNFANKIITWELLGKMNMKIDSDPEAFEAFKRLLMVFGQIDYEPRTFNNFMSFIDINLFTLNDRRRIMI